MTAIPKPTYPKKMMRARLEILRNPFLLDRDLAVLAGTSTRTVTSARASLIADGLISKDTQAPIDPVEKHKYSAPTEGGADLDTKPTNPAVDIGALLDADASLTPAAKRKILDDLAKSADNPQVRIQAILASARLDAAEGKRDALGPGAPLTDEDKIHRLALLLEACGTYLATHAWKQAFKNEPPVDGPSTRTENPQTPSEP